MKRALLMSCLAVLLLLVAVSPAYAQEGEGNQTIFGRDFTVHAGESIRGDLAVIGGNVTVEEGGYIGGDLAVAGGNAEVAGEVRGDVAALGGDLHLASTARVHGSVVVLGGVLTEEEGAEVRGDKVQGLLWPFSGRVEGPRPTLITPYVRLGAERPPVLDLILGLLRTAFVIVGLAVLGILLALFLPEQARRVGRAVVEAPLVSLGVGLLTALVAALLLPLLVLISTVLLLICIGIFGYALIALVVLALAAAWIFGWIAIGWVAGERLLQAIGVRQPEPWMAAGLGVLLLSLLGAVPCVGLLVSVVVGSMGLGAAILTRMGTQRYPMPRLGPPPPELREPPAPPSPPVPTAPFPPEAEAPPPVPRPTEEPAAPAPEGPVIVEAEAPAPRATIGKK